MTGETLLLGTIGQSVWRSEDGGASWTRGKGAIFMESDVRAILPLGGTNVLLGSETGLSRSDDTGVSWRPVSGFPTGYQVWMLGTSPKPAAGDVSSNTPSQVRIWAGTCPAGLFYSDDGGVEWAEASSRWLRTCANGALATRVTSFLVGGQRLLAGVEIDGIQRSEDGGVTWRSCSEGLTSLDLHGLAQVGGPSGSGQPAPLVAATNQDCFLSHDDGLTWKPLGVGKHFRWSYCRAVVWDSDGKSLLVGNGSGPPGDGGALWRTSDLGSTWQEERLPTPPNSTLWEIIVTPGATWTYSVLGQVYRQPRGGAWEKLGREFGEIRSLRVIPAAATSPSS